MRHDGLFARRVAFFVNDSQGNVWRGGGGRKVLFIFVRVSAAGRALPATLAWWILGRRVNYSSSCRRCTLSFLKVRGVGEVG